MLRTIKAWWAAALTCFRGSRSSAAPTTTTTKPKKASSERQQQVRDAPARTVSSQLPTPDAHDTDKLCTGPPIVSRHLRPHLFFGPTSFNPSAASAAPLDTWGEQPGSFSPLAPGVFPSAGD